MTWITPFDVSMSVFTTRALSTRTPALTLELGAAHAVDEDNVRAGVAAVWGVLAHIGMVEPDEGGSPPRALPPGFLGRVLRYGHRPLPGRTGIVRFRVGPGEAVEKGTTLALVQDVFGRTLETLRAQGDALVLGHADSSLAMPGVPLVALALPPREAREGRSKGA